MDLETTISTAAGVIIGGIITWLTSWYFAAKAARETDDALKQFAAQLSSTIPTSAANAYAARQIWNTVFAASPLAMKLLMKVAAKEGEIAEHAEEVAPPAVPPNP